MDIPAETPIVALTRNLAVMASAWRYIRDAECRDPRADGLSKELEARMDATREVLNDYETVKHPA